MNAIVAFCFLVILGLLLCSVSFGLKFYEKQRRSRLVQMLRTVTENGEEQHVNLLIDSTEKKEGVDDLLSSFNLKDRMAKALNESGLDWTINRLAITSGVTFLIGAVASLWIPMSSPLALRALAVGMCAGLLPYMYVSKKRTGRINALETQLPDALDFLARSMRAGHAFSISLEMVGEEIHEPLGPEFRALFIEQNLGASLERAFAGFARRVPISDVRFFCSAVILQRQTGGNLSGNFLNRLSHIIRERFKLKRPGESRQRARKAHGYDTDSPADCNYGRSYAHVARISAGYVRKTHSGKKIVAAGVVAQFLGNFFIRKIIKIRV